MVTRKSAAQIEQMRSAGRIVAELLALLGAEVRPGVTTAELDAIARRHMARSGATPSFLGYLGNQRYGKGSRAYPAVICVSIDDEIVHGVPGNRAIEPGQLVSIDIAVAVNGWHADAARTFAVGQTSSDAQRLLETTHLGLMAGIAAARPGAAVWEISAAIASVAKGEKLGIARGLVGHGIGSHMHEEPDVPNEPMADSELILQPGHCLALEPMFTLGRGQAEILDDHWTIVTADHSLAAHFEHTIAITPAGAEILTSP